jgi:hypothetical protein
VESIRHDVEGLILLLVCGFCCGSLLVVVELGEEGTNWDGTMLGSSFSNCTSNNWINVSSGRLPPKIRIC